MALGMFLSVSVLPWLSAHAQTQKIRIAYSSRSNTITPFYVAASKEVAGRSYYYVELKALTKDGQMKDAELESLIERLGEKKRPLDEV